MKNSPKEWNNDWNNWKYLPSNWSCTSFPPGWTFSHSRDVKRKGARTSAGLHGVKYVPFERDRNYLTYLLWEIFDVSFCTEIKLCINSTFFLPSKPVYVQEKGNVDIFLIVPREKLGPWLMKRGRGWETGPFSGLKNETAKANTLFLKHASNPGRSQRGYTRFPRWSLCDCLWEKN